MSLAGLIKVLRSVVEILEVYSVYKQKKIDIDSDESLKDEVKS